MIAPFVDWFVAKKTAAFTISWVKPTIYILLFVAWGATYGYTYVKGHDHGKVSVELSVAKRETAELKRAKDEVERLIKEINVVQTNYDSIKGQLTRRRTAEVEHPSVTGATNLYQACRCEYQRCAATESNAAHVMKQPNDLLNQRNTDILLPIAPVAPISPLPPQ